MLNLEITNIRTMTITRSVVDINNIDFNILLQDNSVVHFSQLSATGKLRGHGTLDGKRVAIKEALLKADWLDHINGILIRNNEDSDKLLSIPLYGNKGKLSYTNPELVKEESVLTNNQYVSYQQMVEHEFYQAVSHLTKYDHIYYNALNSTLLEVMAKYKANYPHEVVEYGNQLLYAIRKDWGEYKVANPQFNRIAKGLVLNYIAKHSIYFKDLYKEVEIERKVSYTAELYLQRLVGYFDWLNIQYYTMEDLKERIYRFNLREKKHVVVESEDLAKTLNIIYKSYIHNIESLDVLSKQNVISAISSVSISI